MYNSALRKSEAIGLDWPEDIDLAGTGWRSWAKATPSRSWITISAACVRLLRRLAFRPGGDRPGPVFVSHVRRDAAADAALMAVVTDSGRWPGVGRRRKATERAWEANADRPPWNAQRLLHFVHDELVAELKRMPQRESIVSWTELSRRPDWPALFGPMAFATPASPELSN